eukprot:TRINITY_DN8983_c1_g2_i1.p2 TRINITY_DN8983_c1_g2~~TRINITY_DN8983_c1_g2_i1.p2  ORF type:complete len:133 (+),score=17.36 TRINITY_DN8983_c1_g2_i1:81-479(+)
MAQQPLGEKISVLFLFAVVSTTQVYSQATVDDATCEQSSSNINQKTGDKNGEDQAEDESNLLQLSHNRTAHKADHEKIAGKHRSSDTCCTSGLVPTFTTDKGLAKSDCNSAADIACAFDGCSGHLLLDSCRL